MTTYEAEDKLMELLETVRGLPSDTCILSATAVDYAAQVHTYDSDMEHIAATFTGAGPKMEQYTDDTDIVYCMNGNVKVMKLIERAAALSGTEDSGNEKDVT